MSKIKIICDSACDIKKDFVEKFNIDVLPISIIFKDKEYLDYYDFEPEEFYKILEENTGELPSTSQVTPEAFSNAFKKAESEGYDEAIVITLNSLASGTYQSANIAKSLYHEENNTNFKISIINSKTYACLISAGIRKAVEFVQSGATSDEICTMLNEFYPKSQAVVAVGTLENLIKKGRIGKITGVVGGILNIKPIIEICNEQIESIDKVRGNSMIVPKLMELVEKKMDPNSPYILAIKGKDTPEFQQLLVELKAKYPDKELIVENIGSVIAINVGTYVVAVGYISK